MTGTAWTPRLPPAMRRNSAALLAALAAVGALAACAEGGVGASEDRDRAYGAAIRRMNYPCDVVRAVTVRAPGPDGLVEVRCFAGGGGQSEVNRTFEYMITTGPEPGSIREVRRRL